MGWAPLAMPLAKSLRWKLLLHTASQMYITVHLFGHSDAAMHAEQFEFCNKHKAWC